MTAIVPRISTDLANEYLPYARRIKWNGGGMLKLNDKLENRG